MLLVQITADRAFLEDIFRVESGLNLEMKLNFNYFFFYLIWMRFWSR